MRDLSRCPCSLVGLCRRNGRPVVLVLAAAVWPVALGQGRLADHQTTNLT
jgi:hypothetical protein